MSGSAPRWFTVQRPSVVNYIDRIQRVTATRNRQLVSTVAADGLRSAVTTNYVQSRKRTKFGERAFLYAASAVWNSLTDELRRTPTIARSRLIF